MRVFGAMTTLSLAWLMLAGCSKPEGIGLAFSGETTADNVQLLVDETWVDAAGQRHVKQEIFKSVFAMIDEAEELPPSHIPLYDKFMDEEEEKE